MNLSSGKPTAIATHDERMIDNLKAWIRREGIDSAIVEFQLLSGIRRDLQRRQNALFIARALLKG